MINRFLLAYQLNTNDELVWYKKYKGSTIKCSWRNKIDTHKSMVFTATKMKHTLDENNCFSFEEAEVIKSFIIDKDKWLHSYDEETGDIFRSPIDKDKWLHSYDEETGDIFRSPRHD
jgi:hypothetical protein